MKKLISLLICLTLVTAFPVFSFADDVEKEDTQIETETTEEPSVTEDTSEGSEVEETTEQSADEETVSPSAEEENAQPSEDKEIILQSEEKPIDNDKESTPVVTDDQSAPKLRADSAAKDGEPLNVISTEFIESSATADNPRETPFGTHVRPVSGDTVHIRLGNNGNVTCEASFVYNKVDDAWNFSSTYPLSGNNSINIEYRRNDEFFFYDVQPGQVCDDIDVMFTGRVDDLHIQGEAQISTKIVTNDHLVRVGDVLYSDNYGGISQGYAYLYADTLISDYSGSIDFADSVVLNGETNDKFSFAAFRDLPALTDISLPDNTKRIEQDCFINTGLTEITIPDSVEYIGANALGYKQNSTFGVKQCVQGFVIRGKSGSVAETYAASNNMIFEDSGTGARTDYRDAESIEFSSAGFGDNRVTLYGESPTILAGDHLDVYLNDGTLIEYDYTADGNWTHNSGSHQYQISYAFDLGNKTVSFTYDELPGSIVPVIVKYHYGEGGSNLKILIAQTPTSSTIAHNPWRVRVGDVIYYRLSSGGAAVYAGPGYCGALTGDIELPESVTFTDGNGNDTVASTFSFEFFKNNPDMTSVKLPSNTVSIRDRCFLDTGLTEITIPESVTSIGEYAFGYKTAGGSYDKVDGFTIRGKTGSAAETYAKANGFEFIPDSTSITNATVTNITNKTWNGKAQTQSPVVSIGTVTLRSGTDYSLSYKNNVNAGTATVIITGKGDYFGTINKTFTISRLSVAKATVSNIKNKIWNTKAQTQAPVVKVGTMTLKNGTDYSVSYKNNINVGTATMTITGKGNYNGSIKKTFKISYPAVPAVSISKLTKGKKSFTATWTKASASVQKNFTGYQIQYSMDKNFKTGVKTQTTTNKAASKVVIRNLKKKKVYYVRMRRFRKYYGKTLYSKWSAVKNIKTK